MEFRENHNFFNKKKRIINQINNLMRNHPPIKPEIILLLDQIKGDFPELKALKASMKNLPSTISITQFDLIPIFDILNTVEKEISKKPYNSKRGKIVFSHLLWLVYILYFNDNYVEQTEKEKHDSIRTDSELDISKKIYSKSVYEINSERIILNIQLINQILKELSKQKEAQIFREDIPIFYSKLNSECKDQNDFIIRIQSMASIFEVNTKTINMLLPQEERKKQKSINIIEKWLELNGITQHKFFTTWRYIVELRNNPPTHSSMSTKMASILNYFNIEMPIDYSRFWESIIMYFINSLDEFLRILNSFLSNNFTAS